MSIIRDASLAGDGVKKIIWVKQYMPVLCELERRPAIERPLEGMRVAISIHLEAKTAYFATVLRSAGAEVTATGCNPLSTKDDVCAGLDSMGITVNAWHGATDDEYREHLTKTLSVCPDIIVDDGGDLVSLLHGECAAYAVNLIGGCEETTTGIHRLRSREAAHMLNFPMMAVNDANCKYLFDNRYGTGQSVWEGLIGTTNVCVAGKTLVVAGYGWCGKGVAMRGKGLGANVIVTEVNPYRALEAAMDGFRVMTMDDAASLGDIFVTVTGCKDIITAKHFKLMKANVILANAGHFDVEINKNDLRSLAVSVENRKPFIDAYIMPDGRNINLMTEGRLVNITAGSGHPADIMDMSFSIQLLSVCHMAKHGRTLENRLYEIPESIDRQVAMIKLAAMGITIDSLTEEQQSYINAFEL